MDEETIGMSVRIALQVGRVCTGCGANVYAGVFHQCGQPDRLGGPDGKLVEVEALPPPAGGGGWMSAPPEVLQTSARTVCEACGAALAPDVAHVCRGNQHWHEQAA